MIDQPRWLAAAWRDLGQKEIAGAADNPRIVGYFRDAGHAYVKDDETAWCEAYLGAVLERSGVRSTRSLRARSYLDWGIAIKSARLGAVAVLSRGRNPAFGHVGFVVGESDGQLILLGGNQSNAVTVAAFDPGRLLSLRWPDGIETPVATAEGPAPLSESYPAPAEEHFATALAHVLKMEGGYSDDPYDPGGPTNQGITIKVFATHTGRTLDATSRAQLKGELKAIRPELVRAIYLARYWVPAGSASMAPGLALFHFDAAVNHGVGTAIRSLQEALRVDADGEIGPITRAALEMADPVEIIERYAAIRERRYRALPHFWRFGRGWLRRVTATRTAALDLQARAARSASVPQPQANGDQSMTTSSQVPGTAKWWGHSLTVWGAIVTAMAAVLPALGPVVGLDITSEIVRQIGGDIGSIVQAVAGVIGTIMTLYGRARATMPLVRRDMNVRV